MFKFLKDKISKWTKKVSEESEEIPEEAQESKKETGDSEEKPKEKKSNASGKPKKSGKSVKKSKETDKKDKTESEEKVVLGVPESSIEETKEIAVPKKFNVAGQKFEPDTEKIQEIEKDLEKKIPEEKKPEEPKEKEGFFRKLTSGIGKVKISDEKFSEYSEDLEMLLLENNVALEVAEKIIESLKERIVGEEIQKNKLEEEINSALKEIVEEILVEPFDIEKEIKDKSPGPYVILFCGVNGTGKTTSIAKLSYALKMKGISSVLAASDTFRAASIEQLKKHGENVGVNVISHEYGTDPASVGFDAIKHAEKNDVDCVLIDTAGRMYTEKNLMNEIEKISRVCKPDRKIFVGESTTGNDATEQVKAFHESIGIDGIVLSKADIDEKGGTALSVGYVTGKPIIYLGSGQEYKDLEKFDKKKFVEKLGL